ncbi:MAG: hypothetical protein IJE41_00585 [Clostridia bacterium]|nr:hypothetical protein [Clostridia bacterium]
MNSYKLSLGKNGGEAEFSLTDEKGLCIKVTENNEEYILYLKDGVYIDRKYYDGGAYQGPLHFCKAFYKDAYTKINGNAFEISANPISELSGEYIDDILITNRFTVCEETPSIIQETFYTLKTKRYDASHCVGHIDISENEFTVVCSKDGEITTQIADLPYNIAHPCEMVLKNDRKTMRIKGGFVYLENTIVDSHVYFINYNDDLSYYNEENPIYTTYTFGGAEAKEFPIKKKYAENKEETFDIKAGALNATIVHRENTVSFWDTEKERAVCAMLLRNISTEEEIFVDTLSIWQSTQIIRQENGVKIILENPENGKLDGISLIICAECIDEENKIEWSVEVNNTSLEYSLIWCTYPRLHIRGEEVFDLFVPEFGGTVREKFNATDNYEGGAYPSGFRYPMPYYALYTKGQHCGIYFAVHDKDGALKDFHAASSQNGDVRLNCRYHAQNLGEASNSQKLPGKAVWQCFDGDWFDAAEIYKEFVEAECDWYINIKDKKTPEWMKEIPFWVMDWVPYDPESGEVLPTNLRSDNPDADIDEWYKNPIKLRKELGVPIGYHVYNWHQIPFNNDYPHFMPAKERFVKALPVLRENGVRVMPYINALLWDNQDKGDENFEFEEFGRPGAVKTENGEVAILTYEARKKNGEKVELSPMCPSYKLWRDKLTNLITKMFDELDVDAIYLDQIAARVPHLCMDENHSHPKGGGDWWQKNYRELLGQLNDAKPDGKAFTTESNAEVYSADVDGFLSWMWTGSICDVPAFMHIYGSSVCVLGRSTNGAVKSNDLFWKYHIAKAFVCGQQMGWINSDFVNNTARLEFVKKLAVFRYENKEFFKNAVVMRPPVVKAVKEHSFYSRLAMFHIGFMQSQYNVVGLHADVDRKRLLLVNICDKPMKDKVDWNESEYALSKGKYTVKGYGTLKILSESTMECTIDAESFICVEW